MYCHLIAAMWGIRITVIRGDACVELKIRHHEDLINADLILLYNGLEISGHYTGVARLDQTKLKCTSIKKTDKFDYRVDQDEMNRKLHNLKSTEVVVNSDRLATSVAKEVEYDDLKKMYDELKRKYKINNKKLKQKKKLIRNMRRLLGNDKDGGGDDGADDDNDDDPEETEPEVPQNLPQISHGDVKCDLCDTTLPGTQSLRKHMDKMHKGKAKYKCTKCKKVFITYEAKKNCQLKHEGKPKPYQCSIGDCEIRFYNRRSQKSMKLNNMVHMFWRKSTSVIMEIVFIKVMQSKILYSMRRAVNLILTGRNISVNCVQRGSSICTRKCRSTKESNIKDTSDCLRLDVWIMLMHCTYGDQYGGSTEICLYTCLG